MVAYVQQWLSKWLKSYDDDDDDDDGNDEGFCWVAVAVNPCSTMLPSCTEAAVTHSFGLLF